MERPLITRETMISPLLEVIPELKPEWEKFVSEWQDEPMGLPLYLFLPEVARELCRQLASEKNDVLQRAFDIVERWQTDGDTNVREAAIVGLLEDLQNEGFHQTTAPEGFERFLGPESRRSWKKVDDFWRGISPQKGTG